MIEKRARRRAPESQSSKPFKGEGGDRLHLLGSGTGMAETVSESQLTVIPSLATKVVSPSSWEWEGHSILGGRKPKKAFLQNRRSSDPERKTTQ
jgi:hypothetical protein